MDTSFLRQKTTWTAIAGMMTAAGAYVAGEIQFATLIEGIFAGLSFIFLRQGVRKVEK